MALSIGLLQVTRARARFLIALQAAHSKDRRSAQLDYWHSTIERFTDESHPGTRRALELSLSPFDPGLIQSQQIDRARGVLDSLAGVPLAGAEQLAKATPGDWSWTTLSGLRRQSGPAWLLWIGMSWWGADWGFASVDWMYDSALQTLARWTLDPSLCAMRVWEFPALSVFSGEGLRSVPWSPATGETPRDYQRRQHRMSDEQRSQLERLAADAQRQGYRFRRSRFTDQAYFDLIRYQVLGEPFKKVANVYRDRVVRRSVRSLASQLGLPLRPAR